MELGRFILNQVRATPIVTAQAILKNIQYLGQPFQSTRRNGKFVAGMKITSKAAEYQSLGLFRDFIETTCKNHPQVDDHSLYDLKLVADEACTNIISYGYAGMNPGTITLGCEVKGESVRLEIIDFGKPFTLSEREKPDIVTCLENGSVGGFGLFFVYQTMDEVNYEASEDGNCLVLIKKLEK